MSKILRLHRGYSSVMNSTKKNIILAEGELFIEIPDNISNDNQYKFKVGDGVTTYENLPYASNLSSKQDTLIAGENITIAADGKTISAAGGGHTILDSNGTTLTQEDNLQFIDSIVMDDSTNGKTVVRSSNFVGTSAQWNALSASEQAKYNTKDITDDFNGVLIDSTPTQGSNNAVSSGGVYAYINSAISSSIDEALSASY